MCVCVCIHCVYTRRKRILRAYTQCAHLSQCVYTRSVLIDSCGYTRSVLIDSCGYARSKRILLMRLYPNTATYAAGASSRPYTQQALHRVEDGGLAASVGAPSCAASPHQPSFSILLKRLYPNASVFAASACFILARISLLMCRITRAQARLAGCWEPADRVLAVSAGRSGMQERQPRTARD